MAHPETRSKPVQGIGIVSVLVLLLVIAALYVGGEWLVHRHVQSAMGEMLRDDISEHVGVEAVSLEGTLFSRERAGTAVVVLGAAEVVPVEFTLVGHPVTNASITIEGYDRLRPLLRQLVGAPA